MCREHYPELYARIKEAIKGGQWIAEGAMWVEPDTNMTSGESLVPPGAHGKRFFKEESASTASSCGCPTPSATPQRCRRF